MRGQVIVRRQPAGNGIPTALWPVSRPSYRADRRSPDFQETFGRLFRRGQRPTPSAGRLSPAGCPTETGRRFLHRAVVGAVCVLLSVARCGETSPAELVLRQRLMFGLGAIGSASAASSASRPVNTGGASGTPVCSLDEAPAVPGGLLTPGQFLHIPGPNPILVPGPPGVWDDGVIEAADAFHDDQTYYLYYHGTGQGKSYRLGVATASHPLGPFRKHGDRPILDLGSPGSWDDRNVACAMVLKEGTGKYLMWYLYHTLRYLAPRTPGDQKRFPMVEDLGIEILATARPFELDMPVVRRATLGPGQSTPPTDSPPVSLRGLSGATVIAESVPGPRATQSLRIQVLRSEDGSQWKTAEVLDGDGASVRAARRTFPLTLNSRFAKILVENPDPSESHTNLAVTVKLAASD